MDETKIEDFFYHLKLILDDADFDSGAWDSIGAGLWEENIITDELRTYIISNKYFDLFSVGAFNIVLRNDHDDILYIPIAVRKTNLFSEKRILSETKKTLPNNKYIPEIKELFDGRAYKSRYYDTDYQIKSDWSKKLYDFFDEEDVVEREDIFDCEELNEAIGEIARVSLCLVTLDEQPVWDLNSRNIRIVEEAMILIDPVYIRMK